MKLTAIMPARNEDWVIGLSARVALLWCDELIVLDHASTDDTPRILAEVAAEHAGRLVVINDPNPAWIEMEHRQRLLEAARARKATHIALIDADEIMTGNMLAKARNMILLIVRMGRVLNLPMYAMWRSLTRYRQDTSVWARGNISIGFPDMPQLCWQAQNGYQFHHREPYNSLPLPRQPRLGGGVMHLQFVDWERLRAKHALYKMRERIMWPDRPVAKIDAQYGLAVDEAGILLADAPREWWEPYAHLMRHLRIGEQPWQAGECARLMAEHGQDAFKGLDLFGVVQQEDVICGGS